MDLEEHFECTENITLELKMRKLGNHLKADFFFKTFSPNKRIYVEVNIGEEPAIHGFFTSTTSDNKIPLFFLEPKKEKILDVIEKLEMKIFEINRQLEMIEDLDH